MSNRQPKVGIPDARMLRLVAELKVGTDSITCLSWSPVGDALAVGSSSGLLFIVRIDGTPQVSLTGRASGGINALAWSPVGDALVSASTDHHVRIWFRPFRGNGRAVYNGASRAVCVCMSLDGAAIYAGTTDGRLLQLNPSGGVEVKASADAASPILCIARSPDGSILASGSEDGRVRTWPANALRDVRTIGQHLEQVHSICWLSDGQRVASASADHTIRIHRLDGTEPVTLRAHSRAVTGISASGRRTLIASKSRDGTVRLWDARTAMEVSRLPEQYTSPNALPIEFHPRKLLLATLGETPAAVRIWSITAVPKPAAGTNLAAAKPPASRRDPIAPAPRVAKTPSPELQAEGPLLHPSQGSGILYLSDLHFRGQGDAARNFAPLQTDLYKLGVKSLEYVVIAGDLSDKALPKEYDEAVRFVRLISRHFKVSSDRFITVPGNHDVNWDAATTAYRFIPPHKRPSDLPSDHIDLHANGALLRDADLHTLRFSNFSERFYRQAFGRPYPLQYTDQGIVHKFKSHKLLFVTLNSSWAIDFFPRRLPQSIGMRSLKRCARPLQRITRTSSGWWCFTTRLATRG